MTSGTSNVRVRAKTATANTSTQISLRPRSFSVLDWLSSQKQAFFSACKNLVKSPTASSLTILVIAIALALPSVLFLILDNAKTASEGLNQGTQMTLYLKNGIDGTTANAVLAQVQANPNVLSAKYISPEQGLDDFAKQAGFVDLLDELPSNPIPGVIIVQPKNFSHNQNTGLFNTLLQNFNGMSQIATVRVDMLWVQRLNAFIELAKRAVIAFTLLLGFAVILVISNTLRLMVQDRQDEIEVVKLIGGTNRYVLRPFLYAGALYGLLGAIIGLIFVSFFLAIVEHPAMALANLYHTQFKISGFSFFFIVGFLIFGATLGALSTIISVRSYLLAIRPRS